MQLSILLFILTTFIPVSNTEPNGLSVGEKAPGFSAKDQNGEEITLRQELKKGKVILTFYRGAWCRYCMKQLKDYQDSLSLINDAGATLIAVTPEHEEGIRKTVEKADVTFSLIHDNDLQIMLDYGVITGEKVKDYRIKSQETDEDISKKYLPVPALYIIDQDRRIEFVSFNPDYKVRMTVKDILARLE